jgi:dienelactone hydrolase
MSSCIGRLCDYSWNCVLPRYAWRISAVAFLASVLIGGLGGFAPGSGLAAEPAPESMFLSFVREEASKLRAADKPPRTREEWETRRAKLRQSLTEAWGEFPQDPCPLEARVLGTIKHDGYRIERLVFQTLPGIWMTANAYVPDGEGKKPAVLCVHGHWRLAKQEPVVQARCIGLARLGFFVLVVDAFGAGERATGKALGEYHGEMAGATLFPSGLTLSGVQLYENRRAVDYLQSRAEVDPERIAVTGASGGGNQSMYAGTFDERIKAAIPVCSVGNYQAYLGAACCMCEVVPGALRFTEEGDLLGLAAPRALMVINATGDARQFSVPEARKSLARAADIFKLYDHSDAVRHTIIESGHDYNQTMREAMYGWVRRHLMGTGDGSPVAEAPIKTDDPESLRCYPGDSRPDDFVTLPQFAGAASRRVLKALPEPQSVEEMRELRKRRVETLRERVLGGFPAETPLQLAADAPVDGRTVLHYTTESGVRLNALLARTPMAKRLAVLIAADLPAKTAASELAEKLRDAGWNLYIPELRATGRTAVPGDTIGRAPDHNSAEWSLWIGRPLLGQWAWDVKRSLDALSAHDSAAVEQVALIGIGPLGPVSLVAGSAAKVRAKQVACVDSLITYVTDRPYQGQRLGIMAPGILRHVGDIAHLSTLVDAERVVFAGGVEPDGRTAHPDSIRLAFSPVAHSGAPKFIESSELVAELGR